MNTNIFFDYKLLKTRSTVSLTKQLNKEVHFVGSFALYQKYRGNYLCIRDSLGSKKLFYGISKIKKKIIFSDNFIELSKICFLNSIYSVPRGTLLEINNLGEVIKKKEIIKHKPSWKKFSHLEIKKFLINFLKFIKKKHGDKCYVCLSGGLDSTIIAYFVKKIFKKPIFVTASFTDNNKDLINKDLIAAREISKYLKVKHINAKFEYKEIKDNLIKILYSSQDWRDYNVHCASLNFLLAKFLNNKKKIPILTGDMMNEFCADYEEENFEGKKYYCKPKISKNYYQRFLINSLDSSSREVGVFNYFSLSIYQPFCVLADFYVNVPSKLLNKKKFKYLVNGKLIPKTLIDLVLKKKNRAQIVDNSGGILGYFIKNRMHEKFLFNKFKEEFNISASWLKNLVNVGIYRTKK